MYIVNYKVKEGYHWKMFSHYRQAWDFMEMCDSPIKVVKFCPTSPEPQVIWHQDWQEKAKMPQKVKANEVEIVGKISKNERDLIYEDMAGQIKAFSEGLIEQVKRMVSNVYPIK